MGADRHYGAVAAVDLGLADRECPAASDDALALSGASRGAQLGPGQVCD